MKLNSRCAEIRTELSEGVFEISIVRPAKKNALSFAMLKELVRLAKAAKASRAVHAVILRGSEGVFSAGIDRKDLSDPKRMPWAMYELLKPGQSLFQEACLIWRSVNKPVVAVLEGYVWGAGLQLALGADFRIAAKSLDMSFKEASLGLLPDMGASLTTAGLLPLDQRMELIMTARRLSAFEAHQLGLITEISDTPYERALELSKQLTHMDPVALASIKAVFGVDQPRLYAEKWHQVKLLARKFGKSRS